MHMHCFVDKHCTHNYCKVCIMCVYTHMYVYMYTAYKYHRVGSQSVDSISRDERDVPLTQYITNA